MKVICVIIYTQFVETNVEMKQHTDRVRIT